MRLFVIPLGNQVVRLPQPFLQPEILLARKPILPDLLQKFSGLGIALVELKNSMQLLFRPGQVALLHGPLAGDQSLAQLARAVLLTQGLIS